MAKGGNVVAAVRDIVQPIADGLGLTIWDIRFVKEGTAWYLRIFIDKEGGVGIDDCVEMSRAINKPLDDADPIDQPYCLEVSSPGVERELTRDEHFFKCIGQKILVRTIRPVDGKRDFKGVLESYDKGNIGLRAADGSGLVFTKKEVSYVRLDDFSSDEF